MWDPEWKGDPYRPEQSDRTKKTKSGKNPARSQMCPW